MSEKRDYYEVLGVAKDASSSDLKNAFRSLARKYHPDRSQEDDAENKFKEIQGHMQSFLMLKSVLNLTDLATAMLAAHRLADLVVVDLTSI